MNKKVIVGIVVAIVVVIGGIVGISKYTNTPDYVMKQYVNAINNKNIDKLDKITYKANQYKLLDISDDNYQHKAYKITSYVFKGKLIDSDIDKIPSYLYKNPEEINVKIDGLYHYIIYGEKDDLDYDIEIGRVDGRWKVVKCPVLTNL